MGRSRSEREEHQRLFTFQLASIAILLAVIDTCLLTQRYPVIKSHFAVALQKVAADDLPGVPGPKTGVVVQPSR
jgi:hypothetical protein